MVLSVPERFFGRERNNNKGRLFWGRHELIIANDQ